MTKKKRPRYRHRKGRPLALTEERRNAILTLIRAGNYGETAALAAGVSRTTWFKCKQLGEAGDPAFTDFTDAVKKALAEAEVDRLAIIGMAARGRPAKYQTTKKGTLARDRNGAPILLEREALPQWTAAAWALERMNRTKFGRYIEQRLEGPGPEGAHVIATAELDWDALSDTELRTLKAIALRLQPAEDEGKARGLNHEKRGVKDEKPTIH